MTTTDPDPRPAVTTADHVSTIAGWSCATCGLKTLSSAGSCAHCGGDLTSAAFGPTGTVWSSTVVRVPLPGRTPPYTIAYVDLDDGPRVLCHLADRTERVPVLSAVDLVGTTPHGDLLAVLAGADRDVQR